MSQIDPYVIDGSGTMQVSFVNERRVMGQVLEDRVRAVSPFSET
jgi:hypothetical protein